MKTQKKGRPTPEEAGLAVSVSTDMVPKNNLSPKVGSVNLKDSPIAEYLCLLPNGEPSYATYLILKKVMESMKEGL